MRLHNSFNEFTGRELLAILALVFVVISWVTFCGRTSIGPRSGLRVKTVASTAKNIHTMLSAWAEDNNGEFPTAHQFSNEAFRELFKSKLMDDEKPFSIAGDPWHKNSPSGDGKGPDGDIGSAPDYAQALMPGECAYAYVTGLDSKIRPQISPAGQRLQ